MPGLQAAIERFLQATELQAASMRTRERGGPASVAPAHSPLALDTAGSRVLEPSFEAGTASVVAAARASRKLSPGRMAVDLEDRTAPGTTSPAAGREVLPAASTRLPVGSPAAAGSGGVGAPSASTALFVLLVLSLATFILTRLTWDLAPWHSTLLASGLERPG